MEAKTKHFKKRDAILACVMDTHEHPSADWIYAKLKPDIPDISLGTIYRNLSLFKSQGLIVSLGTVKGVERFDGNTHPHVHFICTECGKVIDLPQMEVPHQTAELADCRVDACQLTFTGLCGDCQIN